MPCTLGYLFIKWDFLCVSVNFGIVQTKWGSNVVESWRKYTISFVYCSTGVYMVGPWVKTVSWYYYLRTELLTPTTTQMQRYREGNCDAFFHSANVTTTRSNNNNLETQQIWCVGSHWLDKQQHLLPFLDFSVADMSTCGHSTGQATGTGEQKYIKTN